MDAAYLLIDSGNTRVKWTFVTANPSSKTWLAEGAVMHADSAHLPAQWQQMKQACLGVLIANVAGSAVRSAILQQLALFAGTRHSAVQWFASSAAVAGIQNGYRTPTQLGCDRLCAVIGAHALLPNKNLLIANCGTATTIDAVSSAGHFLGGMILPGLGLMAQALAKNTAQLPQVAANLQLPHSFADNTDDAIISGCITAQSGAIEKALRDIEHRWAQPVHCILSGGAALAIAPALTIAHQVLDNLVLHGLHTVLQAQQGIVADTATS